MRPAVLVTTRSSFTTDASATASTIEPEPKGEVKAYLQLISGGMTVADLRSLVGDIRGKLGSEPSVVALISEGDGDSVPYVVAANQAAQDLGVRADDLIKQLSRAVDGRGGGKADLAQGSGKNPDGIDEAFEAVRGEILKAQGI